MVHVFEWASGARVKIDAQTAGNELERIKEQDNGILTPRSVVDAAQPEDAPLHPHFEWHDGIAADKYRIEQARYMLRSLIVTYEHNEQPRRVRAFASVITRGDGERRFGLDLPTEENEAQDEPPAQRVYVGIADVMTTDNLREQVLEAATREMQSWRRRYREYQEFSDVFNAIDTLPLFPGVSA